MIKIVFFDVDGTLTDKDRKVSLEAISAIRKLERSGIITSLATGNVLPVTYTLGKMFGCSGPLIAENGGVLYFGERKIEILGDRKICEKAYERLREKFGVERTITDSCRFSEVAIWRPEIPLEELEKEISDLPVYLVDTGFAVHIVQKGISKGLGVRKILERLGIKKEEAAYFGDSENDLPAFFEVGNRIALKGSPRKLISEADYVSSEEDGKGVLEGLKWLGLL